MYRPPHYLDLIQNILKEPRNAEPHSTYWEFTYDKDISAVANSGLIYINVSEAQVEGNGIVEMQVQGVGYYRLEDSFVDPFFPTENELALYKLEKGFDYPMLPFLRGPYDA